MTSVLVVDDSQFMRTVIGNVLADHGYRILSACDGSEAVEMVQEHDPDVVTMDVEMPGMDGIEAVARIMTENPTPVLMLSAHTQRGAEATLDALARGAVDFLPKPGGEESRDLESLGDRLVSKIDAVAGAELDSITPDGERSPAPAETATAGSVTTDASASEPSGGSTQADSAGSTQSAEPSRPAGTATQLESQRASPTVDGQTAAPPSASPSVSKPSGDRSFVDHPTVVVGASTGGPKIIEGVLRALPGDLAPKVLVVQHMPESFTDRLAARLDSFLPFDVSEASDGQRVTDGEVVVAKGGVHLAVTSNVAGNLRLRLRDEEPVHGVRPAIDVTMRTAAETVSDPLVGVALTGMGKDGAAGIEAIKAAGGTTIAQDEATSPVFGIPQQAIATGAVDHVRAAADVPAAICDAFSEGVTTHG
jgi:two-component system chemotaxis response regulator CheB